MSPCKPQIGTPPSRIRLWWNWQLEAGATPATTAMIGDTSFDMEMAVNAKVRAVGVDWGYHDKEELLAAGAEIVADEMDQLHGILNQ